MHRVQENFNMWCWIFLLLGSLLSTGSHGAPRRKYLCPQNFVRHGNSCYFFSKHMATWFDANFECKDRNSELAIMEKGWEDRNMRTYLNKPELARLERWIGGIYNWEIKRWVWGANGGNPLKYQGFSQMPLNANHEWNCIIMDPSMMYKWGSRSCIEHKHYICEVPLKKLQPPQPHATFPGQPKKPHDPTKPKKPRDPNKKPRDPNKKPRGQNKQHRNKEGRKQRQNRRRQQLTTETPGNNQKPTTTSQPHHSAHYNRYQSYNYTQIPQHLYNSYIDIRPNDVSYNAEVLLRS